ncbi:MAG: DUF3786 domain-containing protein [Desulforhopalus sp.]
MQVTRSKVFEETYQNYVRKILQIDFLSKAVSLGAEIDNNALLIQLYDVVYRFSEEGLSGPSGVDVPPAVRVMICKYILTTPETLTELDNKLVTYREFKDSGPLVSNFTNNTNKTLEQTFSGDVAALKDRALQFGGKIMASDTYDLSILFHAFPRIPVTVNFNDRDDLFPAACSVLYRASAAQFLDMECLAMTGTLLAGKLISQNR